MHQWRREPINTIDRLGRRKRRRRVEVGVGEEAKTIWERIAEDECHPQVLFSFSCGGKRDVSLAREDQIPTKRNAPRVCGRGHPDRKQSRPISQEEVCMQRWWWERRRGGLIGEDAAHPRTLPFMHIISFSWGWAVLGTQQRSSSHRWFGIVMRSQGWKVSMHTRFHLFSQEGDQCVCERKRELQEMHYIMCVW